MITRNSLGSSYPINKLGDAVEFLDNMRRPVTESERKSGTFPYYGANGLQGSIDNFIFDEPLVLLAEDGGHFDNPDRGIAYRVSGKTWVNNHAHVLRPKQHIDLNYLCRILENYDVTPFVTGTTRGKLTKAGASEIPIPVPALTEQRRIAAILDQADALRAKRREALAQLDSLTQSIFVEMFGDPLHGKSKAPQVFFEDITTRITYGFTSPMTHLDSGIPILTAKNVRNGSLDLVNVHYADQSEFDALTSKSKPKVGDILITKDGTIGRTAVVDTNETICINQSVALVQLQGEKVTPSYVAAYLRTNAVQQVMKNMGKGNALAHLQITELAKLPIGLPPLSHQQQFSVRIEAVNAIAQKSEESEAQLNSLFTSLQHRAFRGEL